MNERLLFSALFSFLLLFVNLMLSVMPLVVAGRNGFHGTEPLGTDPHGREHRVVAHEPGGSAGQLADDRRRAAVLTLLQRQHPPYSLWTLAASGVLALLGELTKFVAGYSGARRAGTSKQGANWALVGGILGGILGMAIPLPVIGPLLGACMGAAVGAIIAEVRQGVPFEPALRRGKAAGIGRLMGTVAKLAIGLAIWLVLAVAAVVK